MLKLPKGLKKKKKGKKSKKGKDEELFTEEELEKYRKEHQQQQEEAGEGSVKENEEWSKFKDLTTGVDSILKKTQGDLDRIKSTSFFQRVQPKKSEPSPPPRPQPFRPVVEVTEADFRRTPEVAEAITDDESEEDDDQDDIFDTSYVEAVERGEVKLAYVPDSPEDTQDDDIFDTSHVDAIIRGQDAKVSKGKKGLDIGIAVEVLTGRIDNVTVAPVRRSKRTIPGSLLLEEGDNEFTVEPVAVAEPVEKSILDADSDDIPITTPIDLSVSLHTSLIQQNKPADSYLTAPEEEFQEIQQQEEEADEFTLLAAESIEVSAQKTKLDETDIKVEPVLQESWSAFEADKNEAVFAEGIVEDQIDIIDPYLDQDDPFNTSFVDVVVPSLVSHQTNQSSELEDDDDFDPRAEEVLHILNNRRKSSVRIHLTDPSGIRESITSDDIIDSAQVEKAPDLLSTSATDLTQLGDSPLDPLDINNTDIDPFDTSIVDKIVAPGRVELKLLEEELIGDPPSIYRVPSDPDFDPRAEEEPKKVERRASRPENLIVNKSVVFSVGNTNNLDLKTKSRPAKPVTPYYTRDISITDDIPEEAESIGVTFGTLVKTRSEEDLTQKSNLSSKRRHSEYPKSSDFLQSGLTQLSGKVLTPSLPAPPEEGIEIDFDPFDTSFAGVIAPCKTELKLLAKEFSCEEETRETETDFLAPADDLFQVKALSPEPSKVTGETGDIDPFDTSFAGDLNPSRAELRLLHGEFLD